MKPIFVPHEKYQQFVLDQLQKHYSGGILVLVNSDWPVIKKLWITDLSKITTMIIPYYKNRGPEPRDPDRKIHAQHLVQPPSMDGPTIRIVKIICACFPKL